MKLYEIVLSTKDRVLIDEDDFKKFSELSISGDYILLKQGVVNPSFIVAILPKENATTKAVIEEGYVDEERGVFIPTKVAEGVLPLADEFATKTKAIAASMTVPPR